MEIHHYSPETGELTGTSQARLDPMETEVAGEPRYLMPANSTQSAPPAAIAGQAYIWNQALKVWDAVPDHRGEVWYGGDDGREPVTVDTLGDPAALGLAAVEAPPPPPPPPTAANVRAEASRRMQALLGARDAAHLDVLISNGTREAVRLLRKGQANWTADEATRAAGLEALDGAVEAIRAASNTLEALDPVPADYADNSRWP